MVLGGRRLVEEDRSPVGIENRTAGLDDLLELRIPETDALVIVVDEVLDPPLVRLVGRGEGR